MTRVVILVGSRALADTDAAKAWARDAIAAEVASADVVVSGGAAGADAWALEAAIVARVRCAEYLPSGVLNLWHPGVGTGVETRRWSAGPVHPLDRNRKLVAVAVAYARQGARVRVVALLAPWSGTFGAAHTATVATTARRALGDELADRFVVDVRPCPETLGPGAPW